MQELNDLIDKFWSNTINEDELKRLDNALRNKVVTNSIGETEDRNSLAENSSRDGEAEELLRKIHERIMEGNIVDDNVNDIDRQQFTWKRFVGIAASILVIISLTYFFISQKRMKQDRVVVVNNPIEKTNLRTVVNNTDTLMNVNLSDGSVSTIYPKSKITFNEPFDSLHRDIQLVGTAKFKVAKDANRPFTVFASNIATTALGTYFKIEESKGHLSIALYEGKLLVRSSKDLNEKNKVYLVGGQELNLNPIRFDYKKTAIVEKAQKQHDAVQKHRNNSDSIPLEYKNVPLLTVFNNLQQKYHIRFSYDDKEPLHSLTFTGRFTTEDKLEDLLNIICNMNNLKCQISGRQVKISTK